MAPNPKIHSKKHIARLERERRQTRLIQYIAAAVVLAVVLILGYGYLSITILEQRQPVAEVNGEKITTKVFQARVILQRNQLLNQYQLYSQYQQFGFDMSQQLQQIQTSMSNPTIVGQQVLDTLIDEALIRQEAAKRGITVSQEELDKYTQEQFNYYPNGTPTETVTPTPFSYPTLSAEQLALVSPTPDVTATPSPTATQNPSFTATPSMTPTLPPTAGPSPTPEPTFTPPPTETPYTLEGYQNSYATVVAGMKDVGLSAKEYQQLIETQLLRQKLFDQVTADVPKTAEQVWARHILVANEALANQIEQRLKNGEDFATLAKEFSQDQGSANNGGDLGWFGRGQMVAEFENAAFSMQVGAISAPIKTQFGWHIVQVLGHAEIPLTSTALQQARQTAFTDFLKTLRDNSDVKTYDYWVGRVPTSPSFADLTPQPQP